MESGQHIVSLSLGTVAEPSAVVVIDPRTEFERPKDRGRKRDWENYFDTIWLERFPAGRPIPTIVARVSELMSGERLTKNCHLLLDISSTGAAPRRVFESRGLYPKPIDLTNTGSEERSGGVQRVPLRDVIGAAQVVLQTNRLKVASTLDLASTLVGDLQSFDPKPVAREQIFDLLTIVAYPIPYCMNNKVWNLKKLTERLQIIPKYFSPSRTQYLSPQGNPS